MNGSGDALTAALRAWTRDHDPHVRAAVGLLIEHDVWLRRADFTRACVRSRGGEAWIDWRCATRRCWFRTEVRDLGLLAVVAAG